MNGEQPNLIVIAGPHGAGKSTVAPSLLRDLLDVRDYIDPNVIATGLSGFDPESISSTAGRIMLGRLELLGAEGRSFGFESTLAEESFAPRIRGLKSKGYRFHLIYLWLPSPELSILRIRSRDPRSGYLIPDEIVQARYRSSVRNFFELYKPLSTTWRMYDNSDPIGPALIVHGSESIEVVFNSSLWDSINRDRK